MTFFSSRLQASPLAFAFWGIMWLALMALGGWQLQRYEWKQALKVDMAQRMQAPAIPLPLATLSPELEYRRASVSGTLHPSRAAFLAAREIESGAIGYQILSPLQLDNGQWLLINRGWLPVKNKDMDAETAPYRVSLSGLIRIPKLARANQFIPDNQPMDNHWFWLDLAAISAFLNVPSALPYILELEAAGEALPKGGQTRLSLPDNHLIYAATWFLLALILPVIFFFRYRKTKSAPSSFL